MDATAVVAVVGITGTFLSSVTPQWISARTEAKKWKRDLRISAVSDAVIYVQHLTTRLDVLLDPEGTSSAGTLEQPHRDMMSARMRLHAPAKLFEAWEVVCQREDSVGYEADQVPPIQRPVLEWDSPTVTALREAMDNFFKIVAQTM